MDYSTITELDLSYKELTKLPDLSLYTNLKKLNCYNNQITSLDNLPLTLITLFCVGNLIATLDNLQLTLIELYCGSNQITSLDNLPLTLTYLNCYNNPFTYDFNPTLENIKNHKKYKKMQ